MRKNLLLAGLALFISSAAGAAVYDIDGSHSQVAFKIRHLVGRVPGRFLKFSGTITYDPAKPASWSVSATIDPASVNTDNEKRDGHLKNPDFFDTAQCATMTFKSSKVTDVKESTAKLHGDLTMHCVTKPVVLDLELGGSAKDPWGNERAGFSAKGKINRKDFGMVFNKVLDAGGLMLGEEVDVTIDIEAVAKSK
ncbi:MAG: YceI family protein [Elusimicrobiota bacterium]